ncbi:MAG: dihydroneopterin aldolase [Prevotellaceae bacterium]|jgi:dihydroneopterin aldolase|nr:dihydroneopterin aldolase [Prevotellaceae bacterium]
MTKITLSNMEFRAFHGCLQHEKVFGNQFLVSVTMYYDGEKAQMSDNLDDAVNYQLVYNIVKTEMGTPSNLIENVACRVLNTLKANVIGVKKWEIELSKLNPPLGNKIEKVSVFLES